MPDPPVELSAVPVAPNVHLTWSAPTGGASFDGYRIEVGSVPGAVDEVEVDLAASLFDEQMHALREQCDVVTLSDEIGRAHV